MSPYIYALRIIQAFEVRAFHRESQLSLGTKSLTKRELVG